MAAPATIPPTTLPIIAPIFDSFPDCDSALLLDESVEGTELTEMLVKFVTGPVEVWELLTAVDAPVNVVVVVVHVDGVVEVNEYVGEAKSLAVLVDILVVEKVAIAVEVVVEVEENDVINSLVVESLVVVMLLVLVVDAVEKIDVAVVAVDVEIEEDDVINS